MTRTSSILELEPASETEAEPYTKPRLSVYPRGNVSTVGTNGGQAEIRGTWGSPRYEIIEPSKFTAARRTPTDALVVLQQWEGFVSEIDEVEGVFFARLLDLTSNAEVEEEEAEFAISDVDANDRDLFRVGAVFRWLIGYRTPPLGRTEKVSSFFFRRLPMWTREEIERADEKARQLSNALRWD